MKIINNYAGDGDDLKPPFPNASDAFEIYNANSNYDSIHENHYYYDFRYGDSSFFVMDTRRYRSSAIDDLSARGMLGEAQLTAFYDWLSRVCHTLIPFLAKYRCLGQRNCHLQICSNFGPIYNALGS